MMSDARSGAVSPPVVPSPGRNVIFLVGYRGTGKSNVARLLADKLGWTWRDADTLIEERARQSIRQIFESEGETGFRQRESAVLAELCRAQRQVIATGGGVVLRAENRALLKESGLAVWLTADPGTIWQRIQADTATVDRRPHLTVGGLAEIKELLPIREPLYREVAQVAFDTTRRLPAQVAEEIVHWLTSRSPGASG
jgi:shikimate kinase